MKTIPLPKQSELVSGFLAVTMSTEDCGLTISHCVRQGNDVEVLVLDSDEFVHLYNLVNATAALRPEWLQ